MYQQAISVCYIETLLRGVHPLDNLLLLSNIGNILLRFLLYVPPHVFFLILVLLLTNQEIHVHKSGKDIKLVLRWCLFTIRNVEIFENHTFLRSKTDLATEMLFCFVLL